MTTKNKIKRIQREKEVRGQKKRTEHSAGQEKGEKATTIIVGAGF